MDNNTAPYFPVYEWDNIETKDYRVFSEHLPKGASIGTIFAEDAENDNLVYSITGGAHQDFFGIFQDILDLGDFVMKTNHIYLRDYNLN